jgi:hypothetical protein
MLKEDLKYDLGLKQSLKQTQSMKQAQAQLLKMDTSLISGFNPPSPPKINIEFRPPVFKIPPFYFELPEGLKEKVKKKSESKSIRELLYIPDFTARALGLEADILSEKQASKRLKQILTGLEIRRGAIINPNKLLKGIPN